MKRVKEQKTLLCGKLNISLTSVLHCCSLNWNIEFTHFCQLLQFSRSTATACKQPNAAVKVFDSFLPTNNASISIA